MKFLILCTMVTALSLAQWACPQKPPTPPGPPPSPPLQITVAGGEAGLAIVGNTYEIRLLPQGGKAPYQWTVVQGTLPPGLELKATNTVIDHYATIEGIPTQTGRWIFTVQAQSAAGTTLTQTFNFGVATR